ncbi:hypothetical protein D3C72_1753850 [compost metagenome]
MAGRTPGQGRAVAPGLARQVADAHLLPEQRQPAERRQQIKADAPQQPDLPQRPARHLGQDKAAQRQEQGRTGDEPEFQSHQRSEGRLYLLQVTAVPGAPGEEQPAQRRAEEHGGQQAMDDLERQVEGHAATAASERLGQHQRQHRQEQQQADQAIGGAEPEAAPDLGRGRPSFDLGLLAQP